MGPKHPLYPARLEEQLSLCSREEIEAVLSDASISKRFYGNRSEIDRQVRKFVVMRELGILVPRKRLELLLENKPIQACEPYCHSALSDIDISPEGLVSLSGFSVSGDVFTRGGHSFTVLSSVQSTNCMHWFMRAINGHDLGSVTQVRLDPLLHAESARFPEMMYLMKCWGKDFDWESIKHQKVSDRGRWMPEASPEHPGLDTQFTDWAWVHRENEIHFVCEEVPLQAELRERGSRYFHAIFDKDRDGFIHMDGATRIFDLEQYRKRVSTHVADGGKIGHRIKVFRLDVALTPDIVFGICPAFFVWNDDVGRYFNALSPVDGEAV